MIKDVVASNKEPQEDLSKVASEDLKMTNQEEDHLEIKLTDNFHLLDRFQESENKLNFKRLKPAANLKSETLMRNKYQTMTWRYEYLTVINYRQ